MGMQGGKKNDVNVNLGGGGGVQEGSDCLRSSYLQTGGGVVGFISSSEGESSEKEEPYIQGGG